MLGCRRDIEFSDQLVPGWHDLVREQWQRGIACNYYPFLVDRKDVADFYKAIDVYWVTSRIEGGPIPLLEAMSTAVACISTPVGIALEAIVSKTNGFIAPFDAPGIFATITGQLADSLEMRARIGNAARDTIVNQFQSSQGVGAIRNLYEIAEYQFELRGGKRKSASVFNGIEQLYADSEETMLSSLPRTIHARVDSGGTPGIYGLLLRRQHPDGCCSSWCAGNRGQPF